MNLKIEVNAFNEYMRRNVITSMLKIKKTYYNIAKM